MGWSSKYWLGAPGVMASLFVLSGLATGAPPYVVTNDDSPFPFRTGVSFYSVAPDGFLTLQDRVQTVGYGVAGGFFGTNRISVLNNASQACVFASSAATGDVIGIDVNSLSVGGSAAGTAAYRNRRGLVQTLAR